MIASDIPVGYDSPSKMARSLASYLDDPKEIRRRVFEVFGSCPSTYVIKGFRRRHLRIEYIEPFKPHEGYYPQEARRQMDRINVEFVKRLDDERVKSRNSKFTAPNLPRCVNGPVNGLPPEEAKAVRCA